MDTDASDAVAEENLESVAAAGNTDTAADLEKAVLADEAAKTAEVADEDEEKIELQKDTPGQERIAHQSEDDIAAKQAERAQAKADGEYVATDVFAWANNMFAYKKQLKIELFLINKNNVLYRTKINADIQKQLQPLFIDELVDYVMQGAGSGMVVRGFEEAEAEENVLQRTQWKNVEKLGEVMHWIRKQEHEIETFVEEEHDLKRMKGVMVRCSHSSLDEPFYVIKRLPSAQVLKGDGTWMVKGNQFVPFDDAAALKVPFDNQLLVLEQDLYVFNQAKLDQLFGYNAKKNSIAEKKVAAIEAQYKLHFAEGLDMQSLVKGSKATINKLQKIELDENLKQDDIMDHAEELGVTLMVDEAGAVIIENAKDLNKFVNLLNDDYMESALTGIRYEIKAKRRLPPPKDDDAAEIAL